MKRFFASISIVLLVMIFASTAAFANPPKEKPYNAIQYVKETIIALDQKPKIVNLKLVNKRLDKILEEVDKADGTDLEKVKEAKVLANERKFEEAIAVLFEAIGENPEGDNPEAKIGSPLLEYEREFEGTTSEYLLIASSVIFVIIGGVVLKKS